ncbi:MAG: 50S ribosomal protein L11 [Sulfolobales archaeon]
MPRVRVVRAEIQAGKASVAPPLAPALQQLGLDPLKIMDEINRLTKRYEGYVVKVKIFVDQDTLKYDIKIDLPTTTDLLLKTANVSEPSGDPAKKKIGDVSLEKIIEVAIVKKRELNAKSLKAAVKSLLGSARSIGLTVDKKDPKEVSKEIDAGVYDEIFKKYEEKWLSS